jgi:hypothetical protein
MDAQVSISRCWTHERRAGVALDGGKRVNVVVLAFDTEWRCEGHRDMYHRIIRELGYDAADVFEMRVTEASVEVDYVDFTNAEWPVMTGHHSGRRRSLPDGNPVAV